jgi:hypothetical protein
MADILYRDPDLEWLDHVQPVGLVVAPSVLKELGLTPLHQSPVDTAEAAEHLSPDESGPALPDPWAFMEKMLGWNAAHVAGAPGGPELPDTLLVSLPEHATTLAPTWAVAELGQNGQPWQLLVRIEAASIEPDNRAQLDGWEASPHQRLERLLRDTGVFAGLLITDRELRLVYAPRGETSGYLSFPLRPLGMVAGRPMLGGLKLLLDSFRLFSDADERRLPALLKKSRDAQASVSTELAGQVLGALHELLRGLDAADTDLIRELARSNPGHLYEGLLTVLMRLVFILYAEDRDLLPSRPDARARAIYETSYSVRGLYARLAEDAALNPDTMDERRGGWGQLLALFRLIHQGHPSHFVQARGGKLFDPDEFPFLEGGKNKDDPPRILSVSDGCILRILEGLMTLKRRGHERERLSYRTLDVEQIGSVYETVMGFTVEVAKSSVLAIKAGKNNRTPVFVALDELLARKGKDRIKDLKENVGRSLTAAQAKPVEAATSVEELAAAFEGMVDERGSPRHVMVPASTPILQPTDERRRTGSHYTPRTLTDPIVTHALEPAFDRLGTDATTEQILNLKICDPAMGSGAFLVEACRAIASRVVAAWSRWPETRPTIPADEDEELHARRLVAQRCLYGVDKNPRAVDLAKLSLWLATLAKDHEFTFLDHALKCGDSLVGLDAAQIAAMHWDTSKPGLPLFRQFVVDRVAEATKARAEIRSAPDDTMRAILEQKHRFVEGRVEHVRVLGDAVLSAFFAEDKPKAREKRRATIESWVASIGSTRWDELTAAAGSLRGGEHPLPPFHWTVEFPEVFGRDNPGFDAIVGNPPFLRGKSISTSFGVAYSLWLEATNPGGTRSADLVAHFFRRAFGVLRRGGVFGLIATNTIGQGDTRDTGLAAIIAEGGAIARAVRRLKWPGEAAVVVSVVHVAKGEVLSPIIDDRQVRRISAYLVEGDLDRSPARLVANARKAFQGSIVLGIGFTFDDAAAAKGEAEDIDTMRALIAKDPRNGERIFPFIGGEEVTTSPTHAYHRYVIDFFDRPLRRDPTLRAWEAMDDSDVVRCRVTGIVPADYPGEVAEDWPELLDIVRRLVKPDRDKQKRDAIRIRWWQYADKRPGLYRAIAPLNSVLVTGAAAVMHHMIAKLPSNLVFSHKTVVFAFDNWGTFSCLQCSAHELWSRQFGTTFGSVDALTYNPSQVFQTFPFPLYFETESKINAVGGVYHDHRATLMITRNEGLTKTYNRFHEQSETAADIMRLRELHAEMDRAVLEAYGWHDLAKRAAPVFLDETNEDDHAYQGRLFWASEFRDEVLGRLLALNAERHAEEVRLGIAPGMKGQLEAEDDEEASEEELTE